MEWPEPERAPLVGLRVPFVVVHSETARVGSVPAAVTVEADVDQLPLVLRYSKTTDEARAARKPFPPAVLANAMQDKVEIGEHRTRLAFARREKPADMANVPLSDEQIEHLRPLWKAWDTPGMDDETWDALCNMALAPLSEKQEIPDGWKLVCEKCGSDEAGPCGWPSNCPTKRHSGNEEPK